jgi:hypothetical protein
MIGVPVARRWWVFAASADEIARFLEAVAAWCEVHEKANRG